MYLRSLAVAAAALTAVACTTTDPYTGQQVPNRTATAAILGAIGGAAVGTAAGGDDRRNAIIGAGIGAVAGGAVGAYMDQQERKLRQQLGNSGVGVTRTAENEILLNMPSDITFDFDRAEVKSEFRDTLYQVAQTLREYESTTIDVVGHADNVGTDAYNQGLSERRAAAVADVLRQNGVQPVRIVTAGYGESRPIATNETPDGRARNRRVEIRLQTVATS